MFPKCNLNLCEIIFSKILARMLRRKIGRYDEGSVKFLLGFGIRKMWACLRILGKCPVARVALYKQVICIPVWSDVCSMISFDISEGPVALLLIF